MGIFGVPPKKRIAKYDPGTYFAILYLKPPYHEKNSRHFMLALSDIIVVCSFSSFGFS
jgi:hypothetical protein